MVAAASDLHQGLLASELLAWLENPVHYYRLEDLCVKLCLHLVILVVTCVSVLGIPMRSTCL